VESGNLFWRLIEMPRYLDCEHFEVAYSDEGIVRRCRILKEQVKKVWIERECELFEQLRRKIKRIIIFEGDIVALERMGSIELADEEIELVYLGNEDKEADE